MLFSWTQEPSSPLYMLLPTTTTPFSQNIPCRLTPTYFFKAEVQSILENAFVTNLLSSIPILTQKYESTFFIESSRFWIIKPLCLSSQITQGQCLKDRPWDTFQHDTWKSISLTTISKKLELKYNVIVSWPRLLSAHHLALPLTLSLTWIQSLTWASTEARLWRVGSE